nr:PREDICTED: uncharacterized protein LOC103314524 isoform X2 [Tribolium castaneum]|eukprot:XP_015840871.1 PREDICTED: uncharacterized protein LOC103314524 isoform X2 [Tribolium castaneum]
MEFVETTLKSWGFDSLVEVFQANDVDYEVFLSLSEEMIKELIPKVRLRYKFKQRYTQFQQKNLILTIDTSNVQSLSDTEIQSPITTISENPRESSSK